MFPEIDSVRGLDSVRDGERVGRVFQTTRKPIVAAVHGACIAGGFEIVLGAHFVYAAQGARFGMEEIRLGLIPGWGGTVRLPRAIPVRMATELLLTGRQIDAQEAFRLGIVNHVAEDAEQCLAAATRTAELIAEMPARAIGFAMDVIRASRDDSDSAFSVEQAATAMLFGTEEAHQRIDNVLRRGIGR
jgi:enoyl-CoA hydratase/carnithine racemase